MIYPVGSIYMSTNSVNPSTLFGGSWEQIKDKFLLASGTTFSNGSTGGEINHKLTTNEIPSHAHGLNNHTHSIPALSGSTSSGGGAHSHTLTNYKPTGNNRGLVDNGAYGNDVAVLQNTQSTAIGYTYISGTSGAHTHSLTTNASTTGGNNGSTSNQGGSAEHNNMPPYLTVNVWKRIA